MCQISEMGYAVSPTLLAPGIGFVEDSFSTDLDWWGKKILVWFRYDLSALHLLCTLFLLLLHQLHLRSPGIRSWRLETPGLRCPPPVYCMRMFLEIQTPGEALVIMVSAPTAAVLGPVGTLRDPRSHSLNLLSHWNERAM